MMKPAARISYPAPLFASDWSQVKHGTLSQFILARQDTIAGRWTNLEQFQAFAAELAGMVTQLVSDPGNGFSPAARNEMPLLKKLARRAIDKYATALKYWQEEILTWEEREIFVSAIFVWK